MGTAMDVAAWLAKIFVESSIGALTSSAIKQLKLDPAMNDALLSLNASLRKLETQLKCLLKRLKEAAGDAGDGHKYEEVKKMVEDGGDPSKKRKRPNLVSSSLDHLLNDPSTVKVKEIQKRLDEMTAAIEQVVSISSAARVREESYSFPTMRPTSEGLLKCPRCDSPNTKFCYYNNYSLNQPRHFCKSCRRYWTEDRALCNFPVGSGCRKSNESKKSYLFLLDPEVSGREEDQERLTDQLMLKRRLFQIFAHNINGCITKKELRDLLKKIIDDDLESMIEKIDINRDGCVDIDEGVEEDFRAASNNLDKKGDGFTTADKLALSMFDEKRDGFITLTAEGHTSSSSSSSSSSRVLFECRTCNRQFQSFQALGGHRASHKIKPKPKSAAAVLGFIDQIRSDEHHRAVPAKPKIVEIGRLYQTTMDDELRSALDMFDENGDGFITVDELRSVVASIGLKQGRTVEDCRRMIRKMGVDGDGKVNFKEFKQTIRRDGFAVL